LNLLDLSKSHVWDASAVAAIDRAVLRYRRRGVQVGVVGLNQFSENLLNRVGVHDKPGALEMLGGH
jgi:sulfate permease, SulP family